MVLYYKITIPKHTIMNNEYDISICNEIVLLAKRDVLRNYRSNELTDKLKSFVVDYILYDYLTGKFDLLEFVEPEFINHILLDIWKVSYIDLLRNWKNIKGFESFIEIVQRSQFRIVEFLQLNPKYKLQTKGRKSKKKPERDLFEGYNYKAIESEYPVPPSELLLEIAVCKRDDLNRSERLNQLLKKLVDNLSRVFTYKNSDIKHDVIGNGYTSIFRSWHKFDKSVSDNAFAFLTTTARNGLYEGMRVYLRGKADASYSNVLSEC